MFGYINKTRDNMWKQCSHEKFEELINSNQVHEILADVRSGNVKRKVELPAFIFSTGRKAPRQPLRRIPEAHGALHDGL